jgi:DNA (cytosine-5)-methyltransferase 1
VVSRGAYYNEFDEQKAAVIREAISAGLIAPGDVDTRSITEVKPEDLIGYTQCHFFAGAGLWSYALRLAGWPDDRHVWTGSCPCPCFSDAGKGEGFDDARHLWPAWYPLIRERRPRVLFGEQVNAAVRFGWLDLVCGDMEAEGYAIAAAVLGAHSAGAPHKRQRLYFCAYAEAAEVRSRHGEVRAGAGTQISDRLGNGSASGVGSHAYATGRESIEESIACGGRSGDCTKERWPDSRDSGATFDSSHTPQRGFAMRRRTSGNLRQPALANDVGDGHDTFRTRLEGHFGDVREWRGPGWLDPLAARSVAEAGATRGFWGDCDWWFGKDGKYRPIEPGLFPLVNGYPARVLALRCWGDAIVPELAAAFIEEADMAIALQETR